MRIVIDLQSAQSHGSRDRGIGRYSMSLAKAIVRNKGNHEVLIALNGLFPDTIDPIRTAFNDLLPQENIRIWHALAPVEHLNPKNSSRRETAELIRESFLASLSPDVVHVSSLFEGLSDDAVTSIGHLPHNYITTVTLYDLIPYINPMPYLENPVIRSWYLEKIEHLRKADLWLAISESSRQEGIKHLHFENERSINVSTDADAQFAKNTIPSNVESRIRKQYGLDRPFVMYTGGIDHRKNIEGLIRAFARLPEKIRADYQLAIVCSIQPQNEYALKQLASKHGLKENDLILTGFVPEEDLITLYGLCALFIFPSWHEGFGLPALEAMRCGAPVIAANSSSLPEVVGLNEALFDPYSEEAMAQAIERGLTDQNFRLRLLEHGEKQSTRFSWDESANRTIAAMEMLVAKKNAEPFVLIDSRPRMAYISPLPPARSGIADYSSELLPALSQHYEIDVITEDSVSDDWINQNCEIRRIEWFLNHREHYDRVLYHFGNSTFHQHMFDLLEKVPGVVVLHDFYLSGIHAHLELHDLSPGFWSRELYNSHGYHAFSKRYHEKDVADVIWGFPCSLSVIQNSLGTIVHSPNSYRLAQHWYGISDDEWAIIPHMRDSRINEDKVSARQKLGYKPDDFIVCSFGILGPTKLNHRLIDAWLESRLGSDPNCHLVFVGESCQGDYGSQIARKIKGKNISITGWANTEIFRRYLEASDLGVQLRTLSRGETSGTVLDCMNHGLATIVNANGSMADLDGSAVCMLPDIFTDNQLITALETLWNNENQRIELGNRARKIILNKHSPETCAQLYRDVIESFYIQNSARLPAALPAIAAICKTTSSEAELVSLARAMARSFPKKDSLKQLMVDATALISNNTGHRDASLDAALLIHLIMNPPKGYRVEPVYALPDIGFSYARALTQRLLKCPDNTLFDRPIDFNVGDLFLSLDAPSNAIANQEGFLQEMQRQGVTLLLSVGKASADNQAVDVTIESNAEQSLMSGTSFFAPEDIEHIYTEIIHTINQF